MKKKEKAFCPYCGVSTVTRTENDVTRAYCPYCATFFYENPLPVVSSILAYGRSILLVKRGNDPYKGEWCLPTGFAETGESIEDALLRELEEETGVKANIIGLVHVDSVMDYYYGDLIFLTFEVEQVGGVLKPGDDSVEVKYASLENLPSLAFSANNKAVKAYMKSKSEYWAIVDSFRHAMAPDQSDAGKKNLLSSRLTDTVEKNAEQIARLWIQDVSSNRSTPTYHSFDKARLYRRVHSILSQFDKWLGGYYSDNDIRDFYMQLGRERRKEGFKLSEVLSALSLTRKHIWEFALTRGMWQKTIDIYMALELDRRIIIFFDKASFYTTQGYEEHPREKQNIF
ncbi:MAG: NUDIX domain-containing protein [Deltaproteobacteria bacterium]|nr:NUDIX domain-containing protein [Deltaproteobacteria bacterium]